MPAKSKKEVSPAKKAPAKPKPKAAAKAAPAPVKAAAAKKAELKKVTTAGKAVAQKAAPTKPTAPVKGAKAAPVTAAKAAGKSASEVATEKAGAKATQRANARAAAPVKKALKHYVDRPHGDQNCREVACEGLSIAAGYCRLHYIKNWKKIKRKEEILAGGRLNQFMEELVSKYPDKYLEAIRMDLSADKEFAKVIYDLDLDESTDEFAEDESLEGVIESPGSIKSGGFEDDSEGF